MLLNSIRVPIGCTSELTHRGQQFLSTLFERYDKDRDGALSPAEVDSLFSTCPSPLWGPDFHRTVSTDLKVLYRIDIYMCGVLNTQQLVIVIFLALSIASCCV
jgi:hypothetical protein